MTRKRVTAIEKKQRHEWAVRQIDAGMGLSELTAFTAGTTHRSIGSLSSYQNQFPYALSPLTLHTCNRLEL